MLIRKGGHFTQPVTWLPNMLLQNPKCSYISRVTIVLPGLFSIMTGLVLQPVASLKASESIYLKISLLTYT